MPNPVPVNAPGGYAPASAVGYTEVDSSFSQVSPDKPLPVTTISVTAPAALSGTAAASTVAGPFSPTSGKPLVLSLSGTWTGTVKVLRSTDGGTTKLPLTAAGSTWGQYSANCNEPVWQETVSGVSFYLDITIGSGSLAYRMAQ